MKEKPVRKKIDQKTVHDFILSGHSILTAFNPETNGHVTFMIDRTKFDDNSYFVKIRGDRDNNMLITPEIKKNHKNWLYIGMYEPMSRRQDKFHITRNSKVDQWSDSFLKFKWLLAASVKWMLGDKKYPSIEIYHEGYCGRCGRQLTKPESIQLGYGSTCYKKVQNG